MLLSKVNNRWQAFGIHLIISLLLFLILLALIIFVWFPGVFFHLGGLKGIKIVAGVDFIIGPVLTLLVFNRAKKSLPWDLAIIGLIQFSALAAGVWIVYQERPAVQLLSYDGVYIYTFGDFKHYKTDISKLKNMGGSYPKLAVLDLPQNEKDIMKIKFASEFAEMKPLEMRVDLYLPLHADNEATESIRWRTKTLKARAPNANCYNAKITSNQFIGNGCFSLNKGLQSIKEEQ